MSIGLRIQEIAKHYNISLAELASRTGVSRATMHTYVKGMGNRPPAKAPAEVIALISDAFIEVSLDWLLKGNGQMLQNNGVIKEIGLSKESNVDYKEKYYELTEKVITLQDELNESRQELINCLKAKIKMPVHSGAEASGILG
jgi:transcriptional regulator with XRE-family HTH domain